MDPRQFDNLARTLATRASRRRILGGLLSGAAGALLSQFGMERVSGQGTVTCIKCGNDDGPCINFVTDPYNCQGCGIVCESGICGPGGCVPVGCSQGLVDCGGACVDLSNDPYNCGDCGIVCESGQCVDYSCVPIPQGCSAGLTDCGGTCVDLSNDPYNCSGCGVVCESGQCVDYGCIPVPQGCPEGLTDCGGYCVDLSNDPYNCSGCGVVCGSGQCVDYGCVPVPQGCSAGLTNCGGICVDLSNDPYNCGDCGIFCESGQCVDYGCVPIPGGCPEGQLDCGSGCVQVRADYENCGSCGIVCSRGTQCVNGACVPVTCPPGHKYCIDDITFGCVDIMQSRTSCGDCFVSCGDGRCVDGICVDVTPPPESGSTTSPPPVNQDVGRVRITVLNCTDAEETMVTAAPSLINLDPGPNCVGAKSPVAITLTDNSGNATRYDTTDLELDLPFGSYTVSENASGASETFDLVPREGGPVYCGGRSGCAWVVVTIAAAVPRSPLVCSVGGLKVDKSLSSGIFDVSVEEDGSPCNAIVGFENRKYLWTNFTIMSPVGLASAEPLGGELNLYAKFGLLPPSGIFPSLSESDLAFQVRFTRPYESLAFFADVTVETGVAAASMNIVQCILSGLSSLPSASPLVEAPMLVIENYQILIEAFSRMPHLQRLADALFQLQPDLARSSVELMAFTTSESEQRIFNELLLELGFNYAAAALQERLTAPWGMGILSIMSSTWENIELILGEPPAGSIHITAQP